MKFTKEQIKAILPHRDPFFFVDEIFDLIPGESLVAIKHVKEDEYYFKGHFPGQPIMPGVLILESMAQAGGFLLLNLFENPTEKLMYFSAIESAKFRKQVLPGDVLRMELRLLKLRLGTAKVEGKATVNGTIVTEAVFLATVGERKK